MKRYLVFGFDTYYPVGGWNDLVGMADTMEEAHALKVERWDEYQIVDTQTMTIVNLAKPSIRTNP